MSRLIETLHNGRRGDNVRRDLNVTGAGSVLPAHDRHLKAHSGVQHFEESVVRRPHFLPHPSSRRQQSGHATAQAIASTRFVAPNQATRAAYSQLFRRIAERLDLSQACAIALTSVRAGEGNACVASDLACAAAAESRRVLVIDTDLSAANVSYQLGVRSNLGLSEVLADGVHPLEAILPISEGSFDLITAGKATRRAATILGSRRMEVLLWDLKHSYDVIIAVAPPVSHGSAAQLGGGFDAVYLVVTMRQTGTKSIARALAVLQRHRISVQGCILTHTAPLMDTFGSNKSQTHLPKRDTPPAKVRVRGASSDTKPELAGDSIGAPEPSERSHAVHVQSDTSTISEPATAVTPCGLMDARGISGNWNLADTESSQASLASSTTLELDGDLIADIALGVPNRDRTGDAVQSSEANEILRKLETIRPFDEVPQAGADGVTNTGGSGPVAISTDRPTRPFRISTWSRSLLQSGIPNTAPIAVHDLNRDPWAADVLAVSGLLLIAASVLYVASDALLWF